MRKPGSGSLVAQITLLRQHVGHRARLRRWQFPLIDGRGDSIEDLRFRPPGYDQLGLFDRARKIGPYRRSIEAERTAQFRIPKVRIVDSGSPRPFYQAYETVLPLNGSFIASFAENKNFGVAGDGIRR